MRCDWTGIEPVVFRVAAQIFTIRPKLNLIIPSLIFGPTNLEVELWARIQSPHLKLVGMGTSVDARPRSSANRWNWTVFTSGVLHSGPPRCDADILITVCKVTLFFSFFFCFYNRALKQLPLQLHQAFGWKSLCTQTWDPYTIGR